VTEESVATQDLTMEQRLVRIDTLLCILFGGLTSHPLANTLVPPAELAELKRILPVQTPAEPMGMVSPQQ
jgi:hypothetical protein